MKLKKYVRIFAIFLGLIIAYIAVVHSLMSNAAKQSPPSGISHVIVLGAKLNGDALSLSLYYRVQAAMEYLEANEAAKVIVSGGQGPGESITEAEAMSNFFIKNGIAENRIIREDLSTSTFENFKFSREIVGEEIKEIVVVTNDFHMYRSLVIAKRQGFKPYSLAAPTPLIVKGKLLIREYLAILKTAIIDW